MLSLYLLVRLVVFSICRVMGSGLFCVWLLVGVLVLFNMVMCMKLLVGMNLMLFLMFFLFDWLYFLVELFMGKFSSFVLVLLVELFLLLVLGLLNWISFSLCFGVLVSGWFSGEFSGVVVFMFVLVVGGGSIELVGSFWFSVVVLVDLLLFGVLVVFLWVFFSLFLSFCWFFCCFFSVCVRLFSLLVLVWVLVVFWVC